jgi:hypothetical protein
MSETKASKKRNKDQELAQVHSKLREDLRNQSVKLRDTLGKFQIFYTILDAYKFSAENGGLPIFSEDKPEKLNEKGEKKVGCKRFIVSSYDYFWKRFVHTKPQLRCFYEIILPYLLCNLHVDAEFEVEFNPGKDYNETHECLKADIIEFLLKLGYISSTSQECYKFIILDSSNEKKFSKHYIIHILKPYSRFQNNFHCGAFMRRFYAYIIKKYGEDPTKNPLLIYHTTKTKNEVRSVFDNAIYTSGRNFRTWGSTKRNGNYRPLVLEGQTKETLKLDKRVFEDTLIQRVGDYSNLTVIKCNESDGSEPVSTSKKPTVRSIVNIIKRNSMNTVLPRVYDNKNTRKESDPIPDIAYVIGKYIEDFWKDGSVKPHYYSAEFQTIRYSSSSKYCRNKGDNHKSNHIYFRVYLRRKTFVQGCLDNVDCVNETGEAKVTEEFPIEDTKLLYDIETHLFKFGNASSNASQARLVQSFIYHTRFYISIRFGTKL